MRENRVAFASGPQRDASDVITLGRGTMRGVHAKAARYRETVPYFVRIIALEYKYLLLNLIATLPPPFTYLAAAYRFAAIVAAIIAVCLSRGRVI